MSKNEREEVFALGLVANGNGSHPLREHPQFDEAYVAFSLEDPDEVTVFLRREGRTLREYAFRLIPVGARSASTEDGEVPARDVRLAVAQRFLCDVLEILKGLPETLQRQLLEQALNHLAESGQLKEDESKLLRAFVSVWPAKGERGFK